MPKLVAQIGHSLKYVNIGEVMKVVDENKVEKVDVLDITAGECFEWNELVFIRTMTIETMHVANGETLRNVVGVHVDNGTFFCVTDYNADNAVSRMVKPVNAHVVVTGNPELVALTKVE